jgi:hypothetical protein
MMPRGCWHVRRQLSAFHDGELPVGEQIAVQAHLRECPACAADAREIDELGRCLRAGALSVGVPSDVWEGLPSAVFSRLKAEDAESISGRTGRIFEDLHFVWAALGATGATVTCLALICTIFAYAISSPAGSNGNPMVVFSDTQMSPRLGDGQLRLPSASPNDGFAATSASAEEEDLVLALSAVFTREGRVSKLKVIDEPGTQRKAALDLLDAISQTRFQPARFAGSPVPVAVNMVWLYASLTVKGKMPGVQVVAPRPSGGRPGGSTSSQRVVPVLSGLV